MAVTQDNHIVVVETSNCIQVLTVEGAFIAAVGSRGSQPLQFENPLYVAVHPNGKLFVTDRGNHRVQVLNHDLSFSHCFGREGTQPGKCSSPFGIAIDSHGMVYIADAINSRVQKFTPEGIFVDIIGRGTGRGRLSRQIGLSIDSSDIIYVTDGDAVSMFTTSGQFLGEIGIKSSRNITVDSSGRLFISCIDKVVTL